MAEVRISQLRFRRASSFAAELPFCSRVSVGGDEIGFGSWSLFGWTGFCVTQWHFLEAWAFGPSILFLYLPQFVFIPTDQVEMIRALVVGPYIFFFYLTPTLGLHPPHFEPILFLILLLLTFIIRIRLSF